MTIVVFGKPNCGQCDATTRELEKYGLEYSKVDIVEDDEALAYVRELGYMQAPVVVTDDRHWSGYRPDRIKEIAQVELEGINFDDYVVPKDPMEDLLCESCQ